MRNLQHFCHLPCDRRRRARARRAASREQPVRGSAGHTPARFVRIIYRIFHDCQWFGRGRTIRSCTMTPFVRGRCARRRSMRSPPARFGWGGPGSAPPARDRALQVGAPRLRGQRHPDPQTPFDGPFGAAQVHRGDVGRCRSESCLPEAGEALRSGSSRTSRVTTTRSPAATRPRRASRPATLAAIPAPSPGQPATRSSACVRWLW